MTTGVLVLLALLSATHQNDGAPKDSDRDGDGLSDFAEQHKYLTDPA